MEESAGASDGEQTRFRLKMGGAEIEFVGGANTLATTVMPVAHKMIAMVDSHTSLQQSSAPLQIEGDPVTPDAVEEKSSNLAKPAPQLGHSTNTIAVAMKAETGSDFGPCGICASWSRQGQGKLQP